MGWGTFDANPDGRRLGKLLRGRAKIDDFTDLMAYNSRNSYACKDFRDDINIQAVLPYATRSKSNGNPISATK